MRWQVVAVRGNQEERIGPALPALQASRLRRLLTALQTDGDRIEFIIEQITGYEADPPLAARG